jgi:hypothetical protein
MNERAVRTAFRAAVERYCNLANAAGLRTQGLRVSVTVATTEMLTAPTVAWINRVANDHVFQMLPGASVGSISFPVGADVAEPGYQFAFQPPATMPLRAPEPEPPPPPEPVAVLTLCYGTDFEWECRIGAAPSWLAVGRWTDQLVHPGVIQLPTYVTSLPRGGLLLVRNRSGHLCFGRSGQRPQYEIRVDGVAVRPGGSVSAHDEGRLEYHLDLSSTLLTYRVDWEGHDA